MDPRQQRFRLGLFVLTALLLLAVLIVLFGGSPRLFTAQNRYTIEFKNAPGVAPGTPVRRSGVKIGVVTRVELDDTTGEVRVEIAVDKKYTLRTSDDPVISQDLLSRDTTIDFVPKQTQAPAPTLAPPVPAPTTKGGDLHQISLVTMRGDPPGDEQPPLGKEPRPLPQPPPAQQPPVGPQPPGEPIPPGSVIRGSTPADPRAFLG